MFSADLTWTPVVEVGPKRGDVSAPPSEPDVDREFELPLGNSVSVTSSVSSRKLSVFRWSKGRRSGTASFRADSAASIRRRASEPVAEMPEDRGPERHELPAALQSSPPRPQRYPSTRPPANFPNITLPLIDIGFEVRSQPCRYQSPSSIQGSDGIASAPERYQRARNLKTPDNESRGSESWGGNWRPPEESASSSRGSLVITEYPESSPQTTILSQSRPGSSVLDGLSPPPKSPARAKPPLVIADCWPSLGAGESKSQEGLLRLIRRMPNASAATRWNRANEEWVEPLDAHDRHAITLEKELWLLAELALRDTSLPKASTPVRASAGPTLPVAAIQRSGRILDVCSRQADLLHLAALQPCARIGHLAFPAAEGADAEQRPLPPNVASLLLGLTQGVAFPLGDASFDHVRVTPAAVGAFTAPQLKGLLRECQRVLSVRGMLELRLVDPMPVDAGAHVLRWVESELLVALECEFRCTRPAVMVPVWAREAGLELVEGSESFRPGSSSRSTAVGCHELRVCAAEGAAAEERLEAELGRQLLRSQFPSLTTWPWDLETCRAECLERSTRFRVFTIFALKP